jgi:hypothetical protein
MRINIFWYSCLSQPRDNLKPKPQPNSLNQSQSQTQETIYHQHKIVRRRLHTHLSKITKFSKNSIQYSHIPFLIHLMNLNHLALYPLPTCANATQPEAHHLSKMSTPTTLVTTNSIPIHFSHSVNCFSQPRQTAKTNF